MKEYRRRLVLIQRQRAGVISGLITGSQRARLTFKLHGPGGTCIARYVADFVYVEAGRRIVEDVKSLFTRKNRVYQLKRKWMLDEYGIAIREA